jgi:HSP20 family protein
MLSIQREMNRLFDSAFRNDDAPAGLSLWSPAVDVFERDSEYEVRMELPGVRKDDVKITIENNVLTIRGEKKQLSSEEEKGYRRIERAFGAFQRSFSLPTTVRAEKIEATVADGVLTVKLPKADEARPKEIEVRVK